MGGIFVFSTSKIPPSLNIKHFYCTNLEKFNIKFPCVPPDTTISYIWATVKSLCSIFPGYGWCICLLHIQDYPHTQYQAFLLYQFGEIQHKSPICVPPDSTISYIWTTVISLCSIFPHYGWYIWRLHIQDYPPLNIKHFYCTNLEIFYNKCFICVTPDSTISYIWATVKSLCSIFPNYGWYIWLLHIQDYTHTHYQAFLLYQFREIQHKSPICVPSDSTISYIWTTVKSLCSIFPDYGWYIWLLHIQVYPHTQYEAFLLYHFGDILQ